MRLVPAWTVGLGLSFSSVLTAGDQPKKLVSVDIQLGNKIEAKDAAGIRTLFVIVYDNNSKMRMPWGAMKIDLKNDAKGSVFKGDLTTADLKPMMGQQGPLPTSLRLKARLDKDGSAGPDQPGDIVGQIESLKIGDNVKVELANLIK